MRRARGVRNLPPCKTAFRIIDVLWRVRCCGGGRKKWGRLFEANTFRLI